VDDVALLSENPVHTQILINMAYDYAYMEGYELQPTKGVALNIKAKPNKRSLNTREFKLGAQTMPTVEGPDFRSVVLHHPHRQYGWYLCFLFSVQCLLPLVFLVMG
jgi:hypothetical protein